MNTRLKIGVLGAGLMGHGIAQVFAVAGQEVAAYDPYGANLDTLRSRIVANLQDLGGDIRAAELVQPKADLAGAVKDADFIFEAVLEDLSVKQALLAQVEGLARRDAIIASNTSVIPISQIMGNLTHQDRALGTHWWNPPFLVPLVEVVGTQATTETVIGKTITLLRDVGKTAVRVHKDVPGFIGNRLQAALWREAISIVEQGICDAETVDIVVKSSFGRRLGVLGPLENADLVGTDLTLAIHNIVLPAIENSLESSSYLKNLVSEGKLGMKSGEGFRTWTEAEKTELRKNLFTALKQALN